MTSPIVGSLTVSVYVLGFAVEPLVLAPFSELYGRPVICQATNVIFAAFTLGCALVTNTCMFLVFRFIAGCAGFAPMTIGGGNIADVFTQEKRSGVMVILALGPILGPAVGPVTGGFIAQELGWRWNFWIILILARTAQVFRQFLAHTLVWHHVWFRFHLDARNVCFDTAWAKDSALAEGDQQYGLAVKA